RVVRGILTRTVREQPLRLLAERRSEVVVEIREQQQVGPYECLEVAQVQPLADEVVDECVGARIRQQSLHLSFEHAWVLEPTLLGETEQLVVRNAGPEEERQPRREPEVPDRGV